jgi:hypothetical protein
MTDEKKNEFNVKLSELCKEYNLKYCIFAGIVDDDTMHGVMNIERFENNLSQRDVLEACLVAARVYQATRERFKYMFDRS